MSKTVVISQPMFFPWVGIFEQLKLSDIFVHYNDVQLPQGASFTNRVQIKTKDGSLWMTVPLKKKDGSKKLIKDALIQYESDWESKHLKMLEMNYAKTPFKNEMLEIVNSVYKMKFEYISQLNIFALELIANYFGYNKKFETSSNYPLNSSSSQKLVDIVNMFRGQKYITGLGALNYIDYDLFEKNGIRLEYMQYLKVEYPQFYGDFNPYVSILDLISYMGTDVGSKIVSTSLYYRDYLKLNHTK